MNAKPLLRIGAVLAVLALLAGALLFWQVRVREARERERLKGLVTQALGLQGDSEAVKQIARSTHASSASLLLEISRNGNVVPWLRIEAIEALAARRADVGGELAYLLVPQESLKVRSATAQALKSTGCRRECLLLALYYLHRLHHGETPVELAFHHSVYDPETRTSLQAESRTLEEALFHVMQQNAPQTAELLQSVYGLGGSAPSPFAIPVVEKARIADGCEMITSSINALSAIPPALISGEQTKTSEALKLVRGRICGQSQEG